MNISQITQIIAVVIVFAIYVYGLFRTIRATRGNSPNRWNIAIGFTVATLFFIYLILNNSRIEPAGWAQIMLTLGLVAVTSLYTLATQKQANANVEMAEEMKNARYDTVRPVVDIQIGQSPMDQIEEGVSALDDSSRGLPCILHNIGLGPATDIFANIPSLVGASLERSRYDFGTLAVGGKTNKENLWLNHEGEGMFLVIHYRDVYGRAFESKREVRNMRKAGWQLGSLVISLIKEENKP